MNRPHEQGEFWFRKDTSMAALARGHDFTNFLSTSMSGNFRARRPASPPPGAVAPVVHSQRFPHPRDEHLDADERRAAASKGFAPGRTKNYPTGGLSITSGEVKLLFFIVLVATAVRLFRLSKPNSVV